ncbi:Aldo/keto reductase, partial [Microthyrium microscopicum]
IHALDTTPNLPYKRPGALEAALGASKAADDGGLAIGTKVNMHGSLLGPGRGELKAGPVRESLKASTSRLKIRRARWLIAQRPDIEACWGELTGGFQGLVAEGLCDMWGVREFNTRCMRDLLRTCERWRYQKPRIFQGEYNLLCRRNEARMALLRAHGMTFHAYDPLAQGVLSGQISSNAQAENGERPASSGWKGPYDNPEVGEAVKKISSMAMQDGTTPQIQSIALRWLAYHSKLGEKDCIILSASTFEDLEEKVASIAKGPLSEEVLSVLDQV